VSWVTTRIVEQHLHQHPDLSGLTEAVARTAFLSLVRNFVTDGTKRTFRSAASSFSSSSSPQTGSSASST
jgi:hypothetical protein